MQALLWELSQLLLPKKVYVKSIICQPGTGINTATHKFTSVQNVGSVGTSNKIFDVDVNAGETVLLEPSYPLVLDTTGDSIGTGWVQEHQQLTF